MLPKPKEERKATQMEVLFEYQQGSLRGKVVLHNQSSDERQSLCIIDISTKTFKMNWMAVSSRIFKYETVKD